MKNRFRHLLFSSSRYVIFFFAILFAFVTAYMIFTQGNLPLNWGRFTYNTWGTILFLLLLSVVYTIVYGVWRMATFGIPLRKILSAAEKIKNGDLSARIETEDKKEEDRNEFDIIIDHFNAMANELSSIETLKTDFISNVSHEIKTPLTIIQNQCTILQGDSLTKEEIAEATNSIRENSQRLSDMITNILRINKLENQEIFLAPTKFDLCEQIRESVIDLEPVWETKNIEPVLDIPNYLEINSDRELLSLVWHNLLSNAFKYTDEGSVTVRVKPDGKKVRVDVVDTGCGFSESEKEKIFDKFYQSDTSHKSAGNGLGLALVKRIADIIGADIQVNSEQGKGSTFTVILDKNGREQKN